VTAGSSQPAGLAATAANSQPDSKPCTALPEARKEPTKKCDPSQKEGDCQEL